MRLWKIVLVAVSLAVSGTCAAQVGSATIFAQLSTPVGITTDAFGNILVTSDALTSRVLTTFDPGGAKLAQMPFGNFLSVGAVGYLTTESSSGLIVSLLSDGTLMVLDVSSALWVPLFNLRQLLTNTNEIFDVQTGHIGKMNGVIQP